MSEGTSTAVNAIMQEAMELITKIQQIEKNIAEFENEKSEYRTKLEDIVMSYGDMEFPGLASVKIIQGGTSTSFDVQKVQSVIDYLMKNQMFEVASMLVAAKKETTRKPSMRIDKRKEK